MKYWARARARDRERASDRDRLRLGLGVGLGLGLQRCFWTGGFEYYGVRIQRDRPLVYTSLTLLYYAQTSIC